MEDLNNDGINDAITESSAVETALENNVEESNENQDNIVKETVSSDDNYDDLLQQLQDPNISLGKVKRFKEIVEANKRLKEEVQKLKTSGKPAEEKPTGEINQSNQQFFDESLEQTLARIKAESQIKFKEYEYDETGKVKGGGYSTFSELADDITKQVMFTMTRMKEIQDEKAKAVQEQTQKYYGELIQEVREAFTDDEGILDDKSYEAYMQSLREDHKKSPINNVRQHLVNYLKKQLKTTKTEKSEPNNKVNDLISGRNMNKGNTEDYIPGVHPNPLIGY